MTAMGKYCDWAIVNESTLNNIGEMGSSQPQQIEQSTNVYTVMG